MTKDLIEDKLYHLKLINSMKEKQERFLLCITRQYTFTLLWEWENLCDTICQQSKLYVIQKISRSLQKLVKVKVILGHISGIKFGVLKVVYELSITEVVQEMGCNVSSI